MAQDRSVPLLTLAFVVAIFGALLISPGPVTDRLGRLASAIRKVKKDSDEHRAP